MTRENTPDQPSTSGATVHRPLISTDEVERLAHSIEHDIGPDPAYPFSRAILDIRDARRALRGATRALGSAREMLGVLEDNGGHDGLRGEGYRATLDQIDDAQTAIRAVLGDTRPTMETEHERRA